MQPDILNDPASKASWSTIHPVGQEDLASVDGLRSLVAPVKGKVEGIAGRAPFDSIMEQVAVPDGITFEAAKVGEIAGWWARVPKAREGAAIMYVHGGWFHWGTAQAYRNFVGHIASAVGVDAFIPEYRLAPENAFPTAVRDLEISYRGLVDAGITKIALTGDSAGGNLVLVLASLLASQFSTNTVAPVGVVAFSPVTDLALTSESYSTRAKDDLYFTKSQVAGLVRSYLGETDPKNLLASPLYGDLSCLPPVRVHVGDSEVLLDDSRRYVERAVAAGVDAKLDVWMGMPHGFVTAVGRFIAADKALSAAGQFLVAQLGSAPAKD